MIFLKEMDKKLILILLLAVLIRLLVMPFYFHPDIKTYNYQSSFFKKGVWDIYSYLEKNKDKLPIKEEFVYFPLTYFFLGSYQIMAAPFLGTGFDKWLSDASIGASEYVGVFRYLFILKFPYLVFDIIIAFLLMGLFSERKGKERVFTFWLFNPFSIILIYIFSNVDIIPVVFTLLSVLLLRKKRNILAALCLGVGAGFKAYPLIFLPIIFLYAKSIKEKIFVLFGSIGIFLLIITPFSNSTAFKQSTLYSGLTTRILIPVIDIGFGETLFIALIPLSLIVFTFWIKNNLKTEQVSSYYFAVLALLFAFIHYHIQWLLWIMPFAVLIIMKSENIKKSLVMMAILAFIIPLLYNDKSMSMALLRPLSLWYELIPTPFDIVRKIYDPNTLQSIIHSILAGLSLTVIWSLLGDKKFTK